MNRRGFLKFLGLGSIAAIIPLPPLPVAPIQPKVPFCIKEFNAICKGAYTDPVILGLEHGVRFTTHRQEAVNDMGEKYSYPVTTYYPQ